MGLQKTVGLYLPTAVVGDFATNNPRSNAVNNNGGFKSDGTIKVGTFCFNSGNDIVSLAGTGTPLGFVARDGSLAMIPVFDESTLIINKGFGVTAYTKGDFYAQVSADVTVGQKVFASEIDGSIKGDEAGTTVDGYVETQFTFSTAAASGTLAIISN